MDASGLVRLRFLAWIPAVFLVLGAGAPADATLVFTGPTTSAFSSQWPNNVTELPGGEITTTDTATGFVATGDVVFEEIDTTSATLFRMLRPFEVGPLPVQATLTLESDFKLVVGNGRAEDPSFLVHVDAGLFPPTGPLAVGGSGEQVGNGAPRAPGAGRAGSLPSGAPGERALPELARHLRHSVRTGRTCTYLPETSVEWTTELRRG